MRKYALYFAWVISLAALFGSLYLGEVLHMEPCRLCWYQRIGMFPLALFLGIAVYKNERILGVYSLPLVVFGALFALYQSLIQVVPALQIRALCGEAHCTNAGPIPLLSFLSFLLIAFFIAIAPKSGKE
jgi:disulfide bond formation protein DsbB